MSRILFSLSLIAMIAACEAPADTPSEKPAGAAESATPTAAEKAPEAKPTTAANALEKSAPATTAIAAKDDAPSSCGGGAKGKNCANPDCVYGGENKLSPEDPNCPHEIDETATAQAPSKAPNHFGAAFALIANQPLSKSLTAKADTPIQVTGTIDKVCRKKGCWMVLKDGESQARVLMKNYGFTVPVDCDGKQAAVEGTIKTRVFTEGQVKHLAEDGGEDPTKVSGTRTEFVITASGIRIQG